MTKLDYLKELFFTQSVAKGNVILHEGTPCKSLYFIASGAVKVYKTSAEGKEQILYLSYTGESINDFCMFGNQQNSASAEAICDTNLYVILKKDLEHLVNTDPQIALNFNAVVSSQAYKLVSLIEDLSFKNVPDRITSMLHKYADDSRQLGLEFTQTQIAALAGTAREVVSRYLKALQANKVPQAAWQTS
jgi:CRP/FNR family transcriptional regulator